MKLRLTDDHLRHAVLGGAILGGGGGGSMQDGLEWGRLALAAGPIELWAPDEFASDALTVTAALVGAPGARERHVESAHLVTALELLRDAIKPELRLSCINTNENGGAATVNGWFQAAVLGLPILDSPCNGRAHPTGIMGALGLHNEADYVSRQAFAGGAASRYVEGVVHGKMEHAARLVRHAAVEAGGLVAVARNPIGVAIARSRGAPGAVRQAIQLGAIHEKAGVRGVVAQLRGRLVATGAVSEYRCRQRDGFDVGRLVIDGDMRVGLTFVNEYMTLEHRGQYRAVFPDLIMTFDAASGRPLPTSDVKRGMDVIVLAAPRASLKLSVTMAMPALLEPVEALLGIALGSLRRSRYRARASGRGGR